MTSAVAIANLALTKVGGKRIVLPTENTAANNAVNAVFDFVRRAELESNTWRFASKRAELSAETTAPAFGFGLSYILPADCLRVTEIGGAGSIWYPDPLGIEAEQVMPYEIEGRRILTNITAPLQIKYVFDETVVANWSANFSMMVGTRIASQVSFDLSDTAALGDRLEREYYSCLTRAVLSNEIQQPANRRPASTWAAARSSVTFIPLANAAS